MTMKSRVLVVFLAVLFGLVSLSHVYATGGQEEETGKPVYEIGYIQASSDAYYQMQADAAKLVVDYINESVDEFDVEMTFVTSESNPEKELTNIEDFIAQDVDAIIDFTFGSIKSSETMMLLSFTSL